MNDEDGTTESATDPWHEPQPFRIVVEGRVPDWMLPQMLDGIRNLTPIDGGFTLSVGTAARGPEA